MTTLYHGTEFEFETFIIPTFFSDDEWTAADYGDVKEYEIEISNPCSLEDILTVADELEFNLDDVIEYRQNNDLHNRSINYAENNDFLYIPEVIEALKEKGFDGAVFNPECDGEILEDEKEYVPFFKVTKQN